MTGAKLFDLGRLAAAKPENDPFHYVVVPKFLMPDALGRVIEDFPEVPGPRNHEIDGLEYGPAFAQLVQELGRPEFTRLLGEKLSVPDLGSLPFNVTVRGRCEASDGAIHTDHWSKVVTVLIYPNEEWSDAGGCLRLLRSPDDLEDYVAEVPPIGGTLLAFKRSDRSYHGHGRFEGERRIIQVSWLRTGLFARFMQWLGRRKTHLLKRMGLHHDT